MNYYCPKCGQKVLYSDSVCKYCHANLRERFSMETFGFNNIKGLSISMILIYILSIVLNLTSFGKLNHYAKIHHIDVGLGLPIAGVVIALIIAVIAIVGSVISEDSTKFVGFIVLSMASFMLFESIYGLKETGEGLYYYDLFVVIFQLVTAIFMFSKEYDKTKKVLLSIMAILFLVASIIAIATIEPADSYPYELRSIHSLSVWYQFLFITFSLLLTIFTFASFKTRREFAVKVLATKNPPVISRNATSKQEAEPSSSNNMGNLETITKAKQLLDSGAITEEEFKEIKSKCINNLK